MKRVVIILTVMLIAGTVTAEEKSTAKSEKRLGATYDFSYMSKWMSRGSEVYSENGAFLHTVALDLWGTGFGAGVCHVNPDGTSFVNNDVKDRQRLNYFLNYGNTAFKDKSHMTKYKITWLYKDWYDQASSENDLQVWVFSFAWPKLIGNGLTPKYILHYDYPAGSKYDNRNKTGWIHRFGLSYKWAVKSLPNPLVLSGEAAYRDGYGGGAVDHDWSHATFGVSTSFKLAKNLTLTPAVYHQIRMDDSINPHADTTYCKISLKYKF